MDEILKRAIDTWGEDAQIEMMIEESLEVALALQKLKRKRGNREQKIENVIDELADIKIMTRQMEMIFGESAINKRVEFKLNRVSDRLNNKECG